MSNFAGLPPAPAPLPPSDADLAAVSRSGDTTAYATLSRRHITAARSLARQLVPRRLEADDVVAEAFAEVLAGLRRGDGLDGAFRPYLLAAVRRVADPAVPDLDVADLAVSDLDVADPAVSDLDVADLEVAGPERAVIARAFASLPERWQAVLWHTGIEGARPAEVALLLGLTANGAAVLAYRAREGLRQAYLQIYLSDGAREECRPVAAGLGFYARGALATPDPAESSAHLDQCADCQEVLAELGDVNASLRSSVAPLILGSATAGYLAAAAGGWAAGPRLWLRHAPTGQYAAAAGVGVAAVAVAVAAGLTAITMTLTAHPGAVADGAPAHRSLPPAVAAAPAAPPSSLDSAGECGTLPKRMCRVSHSPGPSITPASPSSQASRTASQAPHSRPIPDLSPSPLAPSSPELTPTAPAPTASAPTASASTTAASTAAATKAPAPALSSSAHAPRPVTARPAQLAAQIDLVGALPQGATGIVSFTVTNSSPVTAARLDANVTLPPKVSYLAAGALGRATAAGPGGWICTPSARGARCSHGPLAAGTSSTSYLTVAVAANAPAGRAPAISVGDGGRLVRAGGTAGVTAAGFPAQFAASGHYAVVTVGSRLAGGQLTGSGGAPLARIGSATLTLPGRVVWAGLYWAWTAGPPQSVIKLRGPGGHYQRVAGTAAAVASLGLRGRPKVAVRQAFADVTGLVARYGPGSWRAAAGPVTGSASRDAGAGARAEGPKRHGPRRGSAEGSASRGSASRGSADAAYLGWTLVVVVADDTAPAGQVMVLGGVRQVDAADPHFSAPLGGLTAGHAVRVKAVRWTADGPQASAFTRSSADGPAVSFTAGAMPYLVGVITATDSRGVFRP